MKIANSKARALVQSQTPFTGSNTNAGMINGMYVVFSYGNHWPLFVYHNWVWFENTDSFSRSTSKHRSQLHPLTNTVPMHCEELKTIYA